MEVFANQMSKSKTTLSAYAILYLVYISHVISAANPPFN